MAEKVSKKFRNHGQTIEKIFILQDPSNTDERRLWIGNLDTRITE